MSTPPQDDARPQDELQALADRVSALEAKVQRLLEPVGEAEPAAPPPPAEPEVEAPSAEPSPPEAPSPSSRRRTSGGTGPGWSRSPAASG